jgi:hypothetical protein
MRDDITTTFAVIFLPPHEAVEGREAQEIEFE